MAKEIITNQEWLSHISPEEWVRVIHWLYHDYGTRFADSEGAILQWLRQDMRDETTTQENPLRTQFELEVRNERLHDDIEKIRAEIKQLKHDIVFINRTRDVAEIKHTIYREDVLDIIDRYRESEEK